MNLELRHLRVVCAIAETGSVTKAASQLGLAQPALTAQLQRIERTLGGPLFERGRHGARPTALGELVLARARVVLPAMRGLEEEAARLACLDEVPGRYRIGAVNGPILGGLISRLAEEYPEATVTTHSTWWATELADMVLAGKLDFCVAGVCGDAMPSRPASLRAQPPLPGTAGDGLTWRVVAADAVCLLLPEGHELAAREEIRLGELADALWVSAPGDGCFADCFAIACAREGFTPRTLYEMDTGGCIDLVQEGHAIALCQATFRPVHGIVKVPIAGSPLRWRHLLGWHPDSPTAEFADTIFALATASYWDVVARGRKHRVAA